MYILLIIYVMYSINDLKRKKDSYNRYGDDTLGAVANMDEARGGSSRFSDRCINRKCEVTIDAVYRHHRAPQARAI